MSNKLMQVLLIISILSIVLLIAGCSDKIPLGSTYQANKITIVEYDGKELCRDTTFINLSVEPSVGGYCDLKENRMITPLPKFCPDVPINPSLTIMTLFEDIQYPTIDGNTPCMEGLYNQIFTDKIDDVPVKNIYTWSIQ
jgi:hypothetical protein